MTFKELNEFLSRRAISGDVVEVKRQNRHDGPLYPLSGSGGLRARLIRDSEAAFLVATDGISSSPRSGRLRI